MARTEHLLTTFAATNRYCADAVRRESGLTMPQYRVLGCYAADDQPTQAAVSGLLRLTPGRTSQVVGSLVSASLLAGDGASVTQMGKDALGAADAAVVELYEFLWAYMPSGRKLMVGSGALRESRGRGPARIKSGDFFLHGIILEESLELERIFMVSARNLSMSLTAARVLVHASVYPNDGQAAISAELHLPKSAVSESVAMLAARELVEVRRSRIDRRTKAASATAAGSSLAAWFGENVEGRIRTEFTSWGDGVVEQYFENARHICKGLLDWRKRDPRC